MLTKKIAQNRPKANEWCNIHFNVIRTIVIKIVYNDTIIYLMNFKIRKNWTNMFNKLIRTIINKINHSIN